MKISRYGITLKRLTAADIERVRQWRNSEKINRCMLYRANITPEMQQQWFRSVDNIHNFYFLIIYHNEPIGLINASHINWEARTAEAGLFVYADRYVGTFVPVLASLCLLDLFFLLLDLEQIFAKVVKDNAIAVDYNERLAFRFHNALDDPRGAMYVLTKGAYVKKAATLRAKSQQLTGAQTHLDLSATPTKIKSFITGRLEQLDAADKEGLQLQVLH